MSGVAPERWADLYEQAFPRVFRALAAALLDGEHALEALHDAFLEGLRRPPARDENLEGWLYRVALRKARHDLLSVFRRRPLAEVDRADLGAIDAVLDRLEVTQLLRLLTERQRAVVVAHYYLGFTQEEIAAQIGVKRGTVSATLSQALRRMRQGGPYVA